MKDPLGGMHWMLVTPFFENEELDLDSVGPVMEKATSTGCTGVVVLGEMGEWRRLLDSERPAVLERVVEAAGNLKVTVGTTAASTYVAVERAKEAERMGAAAVMVSPPPLGKPNPAAATDFYRRIADAIDIPLVVQDFPQASGVHMSPQYVAELADAIPSFKYLKLEDPPTPNKITAIRNITGDRLGIFGGLGGVMLLDELRRGGIGAMTGFAYPEVLVEVINLYDAGEHQKAMDVFNKFLPLILYENQEGINLSIRKEAVKHRGIIPSAKVRHPAGPIDQTTRDELMQLIEELEPWKVG